MKIQLITAMALGLISGVASAQAVFTEAVEIRSIETLSATQTTFIRSADGGWGHPDCPNAQFVNIAASSSPSYREQLAMALTVSASGTTIVARGVCSTSGNSVIAERLRVE